MSGAASKAAPTTIEKVANSYLRALPDFDNTLATGDAVCDERGVAAMLKYAYGICHVKDVVVTDSGKKLTRLTCPRCLISPRRADSNAIL